MVHHKWNDVARNGLISWTRYKGLYNRQQACWSLRIFWGGGQSLCLVFSSYPDVKFWHKFYLKSVLLLKFRKALMSVLPLCRTLLYGKRYSDNWSKADSMVGIYQVSELRFKQNGTVYISSCAVSPCLVPWGFAVITPCLFCLISHLLT